MADRSMLIGKRLGNYKIQRLLGSGGMGQVFLAYDVRLQRPVALKVLDNANGNQSQAVERLIAEARLVASWRHENVTQIYYADEQDGYFYFAMEYIEGQDLGHLLEQYAADGELVAQKDVIMISRSIANALDYAHKRGVVHRDVKPANVLIDREGRVFLSDFGLAGDGQVQVGQGVFGTAHYMSPEQVRDPKMVGPQSDIYSFGVLLYELLTGVVPFDDPSPQVVALKQLNQDPPRPRAINPNLSATIETILLRSLDKDPRQRYSSAPGLVEALEQAMRQFTGVSTLPPLPPPPAAAGIPGKPLSPSTRSVRDVIAIRQPPKKAAVPKQELKNKILRWVKKPINWLILLGWLILVGLFVIVWLVLNHF